MGQQMPYGQGQEMGYQQGPMKPGMGKPGMDPYVWQANEPAEIVCTLLC